MNWTRNLLLGIAALACFSSTLPAAEVPLTGTTTVHFASEDEAKELLASRDEFALALSRFDRQVRMQTDKDVTLDDWLAFNAGHARPWSDLEIQRVTAALVGIRPSLARYQFQLPKTLLFVRTTGKEEGDAAYTRQSAIVLPEKVMAYPKEQLERLLLHELFHVISRHDAALRQKLYATIGFRPLDPPKLPPEWEDRRITNPDAPRIDCYIELSVEGRKIAAAPFLYATPAKFDAQAGGTLFKHLTFRLLVLKRDGDRFTAALKDGKPVVLDPRGLDDYARQIGKNTNYIIHPDEILADNFVLLVRGEKNVPTPRIVEEMERLMGK
ncbi:MAG TPA: hypothetical protein VMP01_03265 [Pirellulaceae bacterium]|nr:hypothetical protein [Pirellulaceae bacterium]